MSPVSNKRIILREYSKGTIIPGETTLFDDNRTIDIENISLNGGILLKTLAFALAPGVLAMMTPGLSVSFEIGDPIRSSGIGVVVRSENPAFEVGDHLHGYYAWEEYSIRHDIESLNKIENTHDFPWTVFLGAAGLPGMTAYFGWKEYARAKKGEVVFVSSGAGAVGSFVIQLAKRDGLKVIGSAGSDEKVQFMKELGVDVAFNYKTTKTSEVLAREGPIDIYWDNVGGKTLGDALYAATRYARFIECGMLSTHGRAAEPIPNSINIILKEISIHGFLVGSLFPKYLDMFNQEIPTLLASKELKYRENVTRGLENAEVAFDNFLKGSFMGKSVVIVADE